VFIPQECVIKSVKWDGEGTVVFDFDSGGDMTGFSWAGAKRKDFWHPDHDWEVWLRAGARLRLWTVQISGVIGFQWFDPELNQWEDVWCALNNFQTKAERKAAEDAYFGEIESIGKTVTDALNHGSEPEAIMKLFDQKGYTGNMVFWMVGTGIKDTTNKEAGEKMRVFWNKYWGDESGKPGLLNPAIMTINTGGDNGGGDITNEAEASGQDHSVVKEGAGGDTSGVGTPQAQE